MKVRFFIPRTTKGQAEVVYAEIKRVLVDQLRLPIEDRRIFSLSYAQNKRKWHSQVGRAGQQERQYEVMAIFESKVFIVFNQTAAGAAGPITLIDKEEVTAIEDFS